MSDSTFIILSDAGESPVGKSPRFSGFVLTAETETVVASELSGTMLSSLIISPHGVSSVIGVFGLIVVGSIAAGVCVVKVAFDGIAPIEIVVLCCMFVPLVPIIVAVYVSGVIVVFTLKVNVAFPIPVDVEGVMVVPDAVIPAGSPVIVTSTLFAKSLMDLIVTSVVPDVPWRIGIELGAAEIEKSAEPATAVTCTATFFS